MIPTEIIERIAERCGWERLIPRGTEFYGPSPKTAVTAAEEPEGWYLTPAGAFSVIEAYRGCVDPIITAPRGQLIWRVGLGMTEDGHHKAMEGAPDLIAAVTEAVLKVES